MIAVATRGAQSVHGDEHARTRNDTVANRIAQTNVEIVSRADIADGRESGHQGYTRVRACVESLLRDGLLQRIERVLLPIVRIHHGDVGVRVDEAGEKRGVAEVD